MSDTVWEAMSSELARSLVAANGNEHLEKTAIARALAQYARARTPHGEPPFEYAVHFFAADGVAIDATVKPAFLRPGASQEAVGRWLEILQRLPHQLDALDDIVDSPSG